MIKNILKLFLATIFLACFVCFAVADGIKALSFDEYLAQVKDKNPDLKSANLSLDAMGKKIQLTELSYSPRFIGDYTFIDDRSGPGFGSTLVANETVTNAFDASLSKKWGSGTVTSLGITNTIAGLDLASPYMLAPGLSLSDFTAFDMTAYVSVQQSLVKDLGAKLTEAGNNKAKADTRSAQYMKIFYVQQILLKTRSVYMALSLSREIVSFRKAELARAEEILKWNEERVNNDLADKADLLQAKGFLELRQLNYQLAVEDEQRTCRSFNELRGVSSSRVEEAISPLGEIAERYSKIEDIKASGRRADVLSAKDGLIGSDYAKQESALSLSPDVTLFGKAALHGLDLSYSGALNQILGTNKPTYLLGLNVNIPLDSSTPDIVNKGFELDYLSAKESLEKAELSEKKDWVDLLETWKNVKKRIELASGMKNTQTERLEYERERFKKGRTTTFLLLNTENDLDDATLNYYRFIIEQISTYYMAELYNTQPIE